MPQDAEKKPKVLLGREARALLARLIETESRKQPRTVFDYTIMFNRMREEMGLSAVEPGIVNNFLTHDPEGQRLVTEGLVARPAQGGPRSKWMKDDAPIPTAVSVEKRPGQLVKYEKKSGYAELDGILEVGMGQLHEISEKLPMRQQHLVVAHAQTHNAAGVVVKALDQALKNEQGARKHEREEHKRTLAAKESEVAAKNRIIQLLEEKLAALNPAAE
jgi:hypothetical protein